MFYLLQFMYYGSPYVSMMSLNTGSEVFHLSPQRHHCAFSVYAYEGLIYPHSCVKVFYILPKILSSLLYNFTLAPVMQWLLGSAYGSKGVLSSLKQLDAAECGIQLFLQSPKRERIWLMSSILLWDIFPAAESSFIAFGVLPAKSLFTRRASQQKGSRTGAFFSRGYACFMVL